LILLNFTPYPLKIARNRIFQGLVTGADSVFILKNAEEGQFFSEATQKIYSLENELMHPLCKGSVNIRRYFVNDLTKSILFPYKIVEGNAVLLSERELSENLNFAHVGNKERF
jgi:hypothetical protein